MSRAGMVNDTTAQDLALETKRSVVSILSCFSDRGLGDDTGAKKKKKKQKKKKKSGATEAAQDPLAKVHIL